MIPPDPRQHLTGQLDPSIDALRASLAPHRRRLWLRRMVRRAWIALAGVIVAEALLWTLARFVPLEAAPVIGAAIPIVGLLALLAAVVQARPSLGETALAVDAEGRLGDRVSSALELAVGFPASATPPADESTLDVPNDGPFDEAVETDRFVRRQRRDALVALRTVPSLFKPRFSRSPALASVASAVLLGAVLLVPNPQDLVIAQQRDVREAADRQADRLDELAEDLESKGAEAEDPRTELAEELRELARQLRERPDELAVNLRQLGAVESEVRSRIDPSTEQRASAMTSLARSLSRAASGNPEANRDGDPEKTREDLEELGEKLDELTPQEQRELAKELAEMESTASSADGGAATALRDAAQSLAQGDTAGARSALDRLGESLAGAQARVQTNRDLAEAASRLQDARRDLADAGRQGQGQQGQGQQAKARAKARVKVKAKARVKVRARAKVKAKVRVRAKVRAKARPRPRSGPGSGSAGPGSGPGSGPGQGQGQGQGQGAIGGGGSNARSLGQGTGGNAQTGAPTGANRAAQLGEDASSVFAPFDRVGKPGDPSYVAGTGGDGQTQQGNQVGSGTDNGALTPYQQVYADFERYAQTSLDRGYVPLSVKDYVRDYFSSLDPSN